MCVSRSASVSAGTLPTAAGAAGTTVTANWCKALVSPAITSTVTVTVPTPSGVSVSCDPESEAPTTPGTETNTS